MKSGNLNFLEPSGHLQHLTEMSTGNIYRVEGGGVKAAGT